MGNIFLFKGTLLGGIVGVAITLWLCIGSMMLHHRHPPLPPVSVEQCSLRNGNYTLFPSSLNFTNYTSFEIFDENDANDNWNETTEVLPGSRGQVVSPVHEAALCNVTRHYLYTVG